MAGFSNRAKHKVATSYRECQNSCKSEMDYWVHAWVNAADILSISPEQLRPYDRFDKELTCLINRYQVSTELDLLAEWYSQQIDLHGLCPIAHPTYIYELVDDLAFLEQQNYLTKRKQKQRGQINKPDK